jgi:hypothetical protein
VQPLPPCALPTSGLVGAFSSAVCELERNNCEAGQALMMKVHLKGSGNGALCKHPPLQLPDEMKWYPSESKKEADGHCFEYAVQAMHEGRILIPAQTFFYFNPQSKKYENVTTMSAWLYVSPSVHGVNSAPLPEAVGHDQENSERVMQDEVLGQEAADEQLLPQVSVVRALALPDTVFGFLTLIGMLSLCVMFLYGPLVTFFTTLFLWWRQRTLVRRARFFTAQMKYASDVEPVYGVFKELQAVVDWNRIRIREAKKNQQVMNPDARHPGAWHHFWQRMECARFDTDRSGEIPQEFIQETLQWITYFEMRE